MPRRCCALFSVVSATMRTTINAPVERLENHICLNLSQTDFIVMLFRAELLKAI
jgi:hypothetical protein